MKTKSFTPAITNAQAPDDLEDRNPFDPATG